MPQKRRPKRGSKGFWPRKRARRIYPRIKKWQKSDDTKPLGFAGFKAGMTHVAIIDTNPGSRTRGQEIVKPATIIECPPLTVFGLRYYSQNKTVSDILAEKFNKNLSRKIKIPKKRSEKKLENVSHVSLLCHTNPNFKKKPEIFEIALGGPTDKQMEFAKGLLGREIKISDVFKEGDVIDTSAVSKGKGFQGPVKRFGIKVQTRKAEQSHRHSSPLGTKEPGKIRSTVPQAGQMGFQTRTELNKRILKITNGSEVNPKGGFINYGIVSGDCILLEGSVPGPKKRLIRMRFAIRPKKVHPVDLKFISTKSKQGV